MPRRKLAIPCHAISLENNMAQQQVVNTLYGCVLIG